MSTEALLRVATFNIHKGFSNFNRRLMVHELRERLASLDADILFLQEVQGQHRRHRLRHPEWPVAPQYEFLARPAFSQVVYGRNAIYADGDHGNAILSRFPIVRWENQDISAHAMESRGLLHCELTIPNAGRALHAVCVHLGLFARGRRQQLEAMCHRLERLVDRNAPLVVAGDFNDWHQRASGILRARLGLREVFESIGGVPARSFPAGLPLLPLDRIYTRGFVVRSAELLRGGPWSRLSDHAPLLTQLALD